MVHSDQELVIIEIVDSKVKVTVKNHGGKTCLDITKDFLTEINGGEDMGPGQLTLTNEYEQTQTQSQSTRNVAKQKQTG